MFIVNITKLCLTVAEKEMRLRKKKKAEHELKGNKI